MRCRTCNKIFPKNYFIFTTLMGDERTKSTECLYCAHKRELRNNQESETRYQGVIDKVAACPVLARMYQRMHDCVMKNSADYLNKIDEMKKKLEGNKL